MSEFSPLGQLVSLLNSLLLFPPFRQPWLVSRTPLPLQDNPGQWLFHCHVNSHLRTGMVGTYVVDGPPPASMSLPISNVDAAAVGGTDGAGGTLRTYYVAADEVEWDYLPLGGLACTVDGSVMAVEEGSEAANYVGTPNGTRIGSRCGDSGAGRASVL